MHELVTFILGMVPLFEIKGATLLAVFYFHFSPLKAIILSTLGSLVAIIPVIFILYVFGDFLKKNFAFFQKILTYTHSKHKHRFETVETIALATATAMPIPGKGVITAALIAYVFNFPVKKAILAIAVGTIAEAIILYFILFAVRAVV